MASTKVVLEEREKINIAYHEIRKHGSETRWMVLKYKEEGKIYLESTGHHYKKLCEKFTEKVRVHAYVRLEYEHEGKKKVKFVFLSWVGKNMSAEHKERMHGHRHIVKEVLKEHTCEIHFHEEVLMTEANLYEHLKKEGRADHWEK